MHPCLPVFPYNNLLTDFTAVYQQAYIEEVKPVSIEDEEDKSSDEITESTKNVLRTTIDQLNWIATHSRPDIAYETYVYPVHLLKVQN